MSSYRPFTIALLLAVLLACSPPASDPKAPTPVDMDLWEREIHAAETALEAAVAAGDEAAFRRMLTEDSLFFGSSVFDGPDAVVGGWSAILENPKIELLWSPRRIEVAASGELAYSVGSYTMRNPGEDGETRESVGSYVSIWRRDASGAWRLVVDIGSESPLPDLVH